MTMCWITNNSKYTVKKTAERDIPVFKVVRYHERIGAIYSFYYSYKYEIDRMCTIPPLEYPEKWHNNYYIINTGFHSYNKCCSYRVHNISNDYYLYIIDMIGIIYSYRMSENPVIMHCVIPKGAEYYENERGEIVSNMLKPISIEEI